MSDIRLAQYIGIPVWELEQVPTYIIDQYRALRSAEFKAQQLKADKG